MSLADALNAQPTRFPRTRCPVALISEHLEPDDLELLRTALSDRNRSARTIAVALTAIGHRVSADGIQRHRRGVCACEPR